MKNFLVSLFELLEIALIALVTVFIVRSFLLQPFLVNGASMEPNFSNGDYLLVDELTYHLRTPERGEVIVFRYPGDESTYYIKRIIGLLGERVAIDKSGITVYNKEHPQGFALKEAYLPQEFAGVGDRREFTLTGTQYFVMGDNRPFSYDSRNWGPLETKELIGLVRVRLWPVTKAELLDVPSY